MNGPVLPDGLTAGEPIALSYREKKLSALRRDIEALRKGCHVSEWHIDQAQKQASQKIGQHKSEIANAQKILRELEAEAAEIEAELQAEKT